MNQTIEIYIFNVLYFSPNRSVISTKTKTQPAQLNTERNPECQQTQQTHRTMSQRDPSHYHEPSPELDAILCDISHNMYIRTEEQ